MKACSLLLICVLCAPVWAQGSGSKRHKIDCWPPVIDLENLGLGTRGSPPGFTEGSLGPRFAAVQVEESAQGNVSLNVDADTSDLVLHVLDLKTGRVVLLQATESEEFLVHRRWVIYNVSEAAEGATDLNGDGDANDRILHRFDARTGQLTNTGLEPRSPHPLGGPPMDVRVDEDRLLFFVQESSSDLNGDGDVQDLVVHMMDLPSGVVTSLGLAIPAIAVEGGLALCTVDEAAQGGQDLNSDGDTLDRVVHLIDLSTLVVTNLGLSAIVYPGQYNFGLTDRLGVFVVFEGAQGADLNGDGDINDGVIHLYDRVFAQVRNIGLAGTAGGSALVDGSFAAWTVSEADQGQDFDGDGLLNNSRVLYAFDAEADVLTNLGVYGSSYRLQQGRLVARIRDVTDLDQDGETADELTYSFEIVRRISSVFEASALHLGRHRLLLFRRESDLASDLNGDGDLADWVPAIHDFRTGQTREFALAIVDASVDASGRMVLFFVDEQAQGADQNNDGDVIDRVLYVFARGRLRNTRLAMDQLALGGRRGVVQGRRALVKVSETSSGVVDLNGDGDWFDYVVHLVDLCR